MGCQIVTAYKVLGHILRPLALIQDAGIVAQDSYSSESFTVFWKPALERKITELDINFSFYNQVDVYSPLRQLQNYFFFLQCGKYMH